MGNGAIDVQASFHYVAAVNEINFNSQNLSFAKPAAAGGLA